jgi:polyisoprenoid-binding protein YceI
MKKAIQIIIVLVVIAVLAFLYVTRAPSAPSQDITKATDTLTATSSEKLYRISPQNSKVTFTINEILSKKPFTAVGTTSQVAGDIRVASGTITIGTLAVNAKTFKTDSKQRDGAISRAILKAEDPANEFIYFKPAPATGLPPLVASSTLSFNVAGDLTISGVTKPAVFTINLMVDEKSLSGVATVHLKRSDFNLVIPNVPFVASVDDEFTVTAEISAPQVNE